ncbi:hypothetical protein ETB97_005486 [Aspergillus alliaceus]|uniref:Uncharacterized protein n=1 Tax=Petromyces alliaceus TaxID=209559 RepID=A0A8H5ZVI2_PETAA|nr:hypothetical protein ETB97_005486 [Aspergillus burnettii]
MIQVERIRCREMPEAMTDLLDSAMQIISAVTDYTKLREQESSIGKPYTWIFSFYAVPAAGVVATELHRCTLPNVLLPCSTPRCKIIRELSLLVSWFEGASPSTSDTYQVCVEATQAMTSLLDETLDYPLDGQITNGNGGARIEFPIRYSHGSGPNIQEKLPSVAGFEAREEFLTWLDDLGLEATAHELLCQ